MQGARAGLQFHVTWDSALSSPLESVPPFLLLSLSLSLLLLVSALFSARLCLVFIVFLVQPFSVSHGILLAGFSLSGIFRALP